MLPRAPLRFVGAIVAVVAPLMAAALGCGDNVATITACETPTLNEKGADGGPDPCHCNPPSSASFGACACLSDPNDQQAIDDFNACMALVGVETDAGAGGRH